MSLRCITYNCNSIRKNKEIVKTLLNNSDLLFVQELMLNKNDLDMLNDFDKDFDNIAFARDKDT